MEFKRLSKQLFMELLSSLFNLDRDKFDLNAVSVIYEEKEPKKSRKISGEVKENLYSKEGKGRSN